MRCHRRPTVHPFQRSTSLQCRAMPRNAARPARARAPSECLASTYARADMLLASSMVASEYRVLASSLEASRRERRHGIVLPGVLPVLHAHSHRTPSCVRTTPPAVSEPQL